jgi:hypothetical protein
MAGCLRKFFNYLINFVGLVLERWAELKETLI